MMRDTHGSFIFNFQTLNQEMDYTISTMKSLLVINNGKLYLEDLYCELFFINFFFQIVHIKKLFSLSLGKVCGLCGANLQDFKFSDFKLSM